MSIEHPNFRTYLYPYKTLLCLLLFLKTVFLIFLILYGKIGLGPDEAQYWTWSRALDWGYYSKPPGIAWQIWLGTHMFGQTELGVRIMSIFISYAQTFAIFFLAIRCGLEKRTAFWCALIMALSSIGIIGSFLAITDNGFLLFWTLACIAMASALKDKKEANPFCIGFLIACGALFKWPIYLFWIFFFIFRRWYFPAQSLIKSIAGVVISLIGLLPSLFWNWSHDWATFKHVSATMQGGSVYVAKGNILEFFGAQALLLSPILFGLFLLACYQTTKKKTVLSPQLLFCAVVSLSSFLVLLIVSYAQKIQGNWGIFIYPTGIILIGWYACEYCFKRLIWLKLGVGLSVVLMTFLFSLSFFSEYKTIYNINPFKHNLGWVALRHALDERGYYADEHFLASDKYQTASLLSFYNIGQKRAYFLNLFGIRKNQFSYWPQLQKGDTGFFVWVEDSQNIEKTRSNRFPIYLEQLNKYFEKVEALDPIPLIFNDNVILKQTTFFKCSNYIGRDPQQFDLY